MFGHKFEDCKNVTSGMRSSVQIDKCEKRISISKDAAAGQTANIFISGKWSSSLPGMQFKKKLDFERGMG
jgi:hypothetical protein